MLSILLESVLENLQTILGHDQIPIEHLRGLCPRFSTTKFDFLGPGVYLLIGSNLNGAWALYVGVAAQLGTRVVDHQRAIDGRRDTYGRQSAGHGPLSLRGLSGGDC